LSQGKWIHLEFVVIPNRSEDDISFRKIRKKQKEKKRKKEQPMNQ
jgi:hypothetical protein